jgi:tRNA (adenine57-N1/adenine58-N1)-methyltransferase
MDFHLPDILKGLKRGPQVVLPKDLGLVVAFTGINKNSFVIDAGTGSGFAAIFFASIAKEVITFESRADFADLAEGNIKRSGLKNIKLEKGDFFEGIEKINEEIDLIFLDLPEPERIFSRKFNLKGFLVAYLPNFEQVKNFCLAAKNEGFKFFVLRGIVEEILVRELGTRPKNKGLLHTGFLCFCKK